MFDLPGGNAPIFLAVIVLIAVIVVVRRVPMLGTLLALAGMATAMMMVVPGLSDRAGLDPTMRRIADRFNLAGAQVVVGTETRIPMARDGHFWVRVRAGGVERRMLVDSGATITALSSDAAAALGLAVASPALPVLLQTANGTITAQTATIGELRIGNIVARDLPVVVSPAFGDMNVIGMNLLSRLKSWRVEGRTLILEPHHPQADQASIDTPSEALTRPPSTTSVSPTT